MKKKIKTIKTMLIKNKNVIMKKTKNISKIMNVIVKRIENVK